jgi:hypothetical protein
MFENPPREIDEPAEEDVNEAETTHTYCLKECMRTGRMSIGALSQVLETNPPRVATVLRGYRVGCSGKAILPGF